MSKVEGKGPIDPPPLLCLRATFFRLIPSRVNKHHKSINSFKLGSDNLLFANVEKIMSVQL